MTLDHWAQKLLIDIGCAATVAEKKEEIRLALTAYAEEQAKGYERIPLPPGWTVGSIVLFQDDGGARGYEAQAWNFWGEVSGRGPTRAEAAASGQLGSGDLKFSGNGAFDLGDSRVRQRS